MECGRAYKGFFGSYYGGVSGIATERAENMAVVFVGFDYMNEEIVAEIKRNVTALLETPEGSCPGDRAYGISFDFVDMPINVAKNLAALSVIDKLEVYEPRVELKEITTETDLESGHLKNIYLIGPNKDYEETEADEE